MIKKEHFVEKVIKNRDGTTTIETSVDLKTTGMISCFTPEASAIDDLKMRLRMHIYHELYGEERMEIARLGIELRKLTYRSLPDINEINTIIEKMIQTTDYSHLLGPK